jgi:lycopene beta-cyclase
MMFGAGSPEKRHRAFALVYRRPQRIVERFYAARLTRMDQARMLCGKPPVPVLGAIRALGTHGSPLEKRAA